MLNQLLLEVEAAFGPSTSATYQFHLGRIAGVWRFSVVDSWQKWLDRRLRHEFTAPTPARAVEAFLRYVEVHGIDVRALTEAAPDA